MATAPPSLLAPLSPGGSGTPGTVGSGALLTIQALPCPASTAACPCHLAKQRGFSSFFIFFPLFFPFLIPRSIPALPQHCWAPASACGRSPLSSSPGGLVGHSHPLAALPVPPCGSGPGWHPPFSPPPFSQGGWGFHSLCPALPEGDVRTRKSALPAGMPRGQPCPGDPGKMRRG